MAAMMAEDEMLEPVGKIFREPGDLLDFFLNYLYPQNHVPNQAASVRVIEGKGCEVEFLEFAKVVQKRPGHEQGAVQARVEPADAVRQPGDGQGMLQQSAHISMVHHLGRRSFFKRLHEPAVSKQGEKQLP